MVTKNLEDVSKKMEFCPKNCIFCLKKSSFGQSGPENSPPSSQMGTYWKTKGIQSCLRIWRSYDPIELSSSEPVNGCSVKKSRFVDRNGAKMGSHKLYNGKIFKTTSAHCSNIISKNVKMVRQNPELTHCGFHIYCRRAPTSSWQLTEA